MTRRTMLPLALAAPWLACSTALASPPAIDARLRDSEIEVGEPTELTVTLEGTSAAPVVRQVAGLDIEPMGTARRVEIVNGEMRETITHRYRVVARRAGRYSIGPITAGGARADAVSLSAVAARSRAARAPSGAPSTARGRAMLRVRVPKRELVLGESVPITIRAYVKAGTAGTINGAPELSSDAFAIHDLVDEAQQGEAVVDGTPYATLTWRGRLTALLPGEHDVSASLPATLRWRERVPRARDPLEERFDALFDRFADDPFFAGSPFAQQRAQMEDLFAGAPGAERSADVVLRGRAGRLRVSEPPSEGRPSDYDGAVGRFTLEGAVTPERVRAGEPFTVRLTIAGEGTFERVEPPMLESERGRLRAYAPTSRTAFEAGADGRRGTKILEQSIVPLRPGRLELGALALSVYDPDRGEYVTLRTEPLAIDVDPPDGALPIDDLSEGAAELPRAPLRGSPGRFVARLWPVPRSPAWPLWALLPMALAIGAALVLSRRDAREAARRRERRRARARVSSARRRMRSRSRRGGPEAFYEAARGYAQAHLGAAWGIDPAAVTLAEARARMPHVPDAIVEVFERADALRFAGVEPPPEDLRAWCACLERALEGEVRS